MFLVSISPTEAVTQVLQPISMLLFSTFSGFLAPKSSIPSAWSWLYYISFFTYALRGLAINEQTGLIYQCNNEATSCPYQTGYEVLGLYDMQGSYDSRWTDVKNLVWFFIAFSAGTAFMYLSWQWDFTSVGETPNFFDDETAAVSKERSLQAIERAASHARLQHKVDHKAYIEWRDLCYSVPIKSKESGQVEQRLLLDHTFGWAQPNAMIALMGASGAGKSTLMDVLALKKNFAGQELSGTVLVNGVPQEPTSFSRIAGYVEQFDSHNAQSTVREAVEMSARLRLPTDTREEELLLDISRVLSSLGLTHLQHEILGEAGGPNGVAPEVRKKVTIAVELIMNPSLLFLDEPTTGLDAPGALSVMKAVRELAREIAVICTIHQPSAEIVNMFDGLLLMKSGGQVAYFGPLDELPQYFKQQGLGDYQEGHNLGDFALASIKRAEQTKVDLSGRPIDVALAFLQSTQGHSVMARLEQGIVPEVERNRLHVLSEDEFPAAWHQVRVLTQRFFVSGYRDTNTFYARWITALFFAFMVGTLFIQLGLSQLDANNRIAALYMSIMYAVFSSPVTAPTRFAARPVYFREYGSRMYSAFAYWVSRTLADLPTVVAEVTVYSVVVYFAAGLTLVSHGTHFALFLAMLFAVRLMALRWNETVTGGLGDAAAGTAMFAVSVIIMMLFSGFLIQKDIIPTGWIWMYHISFILYPLNFAASNELRNIPQFTCDSSQLASVTDTVCAIPADQNGLACPIQCGPQLLDTFGIQYTDAQEGLDFGVLCIYVVAFTLFSFLVVRNVNHVRR
jgi:ABC-type multidrug transport system ATPase subunit/ABC-type multidrug transport system permease subunit